MKKADTHGGAELVSSPTVAVSALQALRRLLGARMARGEPSSVDLDTPAVPASGGSPKKPDSRSCLWASAASVGTPSPRRFGRRCWIVGSSCWANMRFAGGVHRAGGDLATPAKITPKHLKRTAYVYIRQSSLNQVHENFGESAFVSLRMRVPATVLSTRTVRPRATLPLRACPSTPV